MTLFDLLGKFFAIISPILYGIALSYLLSPILNFIEKKILRFPSKKRWVMKLKRVLSMLLTFLVLLILLGAAVSIFIPQIVDSYNRIASIFKAGNVFEQLDSNLDLYIDKLISGNETLEKGYLSIREFLGIGEEQSLLGKLVGYLGEMLKKVFTGDTFGKIFSAGSALVSFVVDAVVTAILCIYLLFTKEKQLARVRKMVHAFFKPKTAEKIYHIAYLTDDKVGRYLRVQVLDSLMVGIVSYIVFMIADLPFYPLLALISGVTNIIPYFGPFIGAIPNGVFILLSDPSKLLPFIIIVLVIQQIDGNILVPLMQSNNMKMDMFWVLAGMTIMGGIFGLPGMIIGVPVFSVLYILVKERAEERLIEKNLPTETACYLPGERKKPKEDHRPPFVIKISKLLSGKKNKTDEEPSPDLFAAPYRFDAPYTQGTSENSKRKRNRNRNRNRKSSHNQNGGQSGAPKDAQKGMQSPSQNTSNEKQPPKQNSAPKQNNTSKPNDSSGQNNTTKQKSPQQNAPKQSQKQPAQGGKKQNDQKGKNNGAQAQKKSSDSKEV